MRFYRGKRKDLEMRVALLIARKIRALALEQERVIVGLPGGHSVPRVLKILEKQEIPWSKVHIFLVDERKVSLSNEESNFRLVSGFLKNKNLHSYDLRKTASWYTKEFKKYGERFDLILLSVGEDGHVASLFPEHDSIRDKSKFYIDVRDSPKFPKKRISASRSFLEQSKNCVLLFFGREKRDAYKNFLNRRLSVEECPAKLAKKVKNGYVFVTQSKLV